MRPVLAVAVLLAASGCASQTEPVAIPSTVAEPSSTSSTSTSTTSSTSTTVAPATAVLPTTTPYAVPLADLAAAGWGDHHAGYPALDLFTNCGSEIVAPVNGTVLDARRVDGWDPAVDNPATRGGRSVAMLGDDGVRYYVAHLDDVDQAMVAGVRISIGQRVGTVGLTGRTSACHVHFGISPPCPGPEWSVRRGVIEPAPYLNAWRAGEQLSPVAEVEQWVVDHPDACTEAMADPFAADSG